MMLIADARVAERKNSPASSQMHLPFASPRQLSPSISPTCCLGTVPPHLRLTTRPQRAVISFARLAVSGEACLPGGFAFIPEQCGWRLFQYRGSRSNARTITQSDAAVDGFQRLLLVTLGSRERVLLKELPHLLRW